MAMLVYIYTIIIISKKIGFWDIAALKDTIFWILGTAFTTFINLNKSLHDDNYFKNTILDNIKFILIIEFIVNLYTFNLTVEMILVPLVSLIVMLNVLAESKSEYKKFNKFLNFLLGVFGLCLLIFTFREIILNFRDFATLQNLRDFLLPPSIFYCSSPLCICYGFIYAI